MRTSLVNLNNLNLPITKRNEWQFSVEKHYTTITFYRTGKVAEYFYIDTIDKDTHHYNEHLNHSNGDTFIEGLMISTFLVEKESIIFYKKWFLWFKKVARKFF